MSLFRFVIQLATILSLSLLINRSTTAIDVLGNVSDIYSQSSLSNCTVTIFNLDLSTQTDNNGHFAFFGIPEGTYTFMVGHPDYRPIILPGVVVSASCCGLFSGGFTGNTNCDTGGLRDLADITRLIDNIYISKNALCCPANGNINGDSLALIDLADITKLIDHVYISKAETTPCN